MSERFTLQENFTCAGENGLPRTISVEKNYVYTHNNIRWENGICYICCKGNKFFAITPPLQNVRIRFRSAFHNIVGSHGCGIYFRYDRVLRQGYAVELLKEDSGAYLSLCRIDREDTEELERIALEPGVMAAENTLEVQVHDTAVQVSVGENTYAFCNAVPLQKEAGEAGIAFFGDVGELSLEELTLESDDHLRTEEILPPTTAQIPLRNGGNIPYTLTWSVRRAGEITYLRYRLAGGPQDREKDPAFPRYTGQYSVEKARITGPYIAVYDGNGKRTCRNIIFSGRLSVTDPGLHWKEMLREYFSIVDLPMEGEFPVTGDIQKIAFGYENFCSGGYCMQTEQNVEFAFDPASAALLSEGKAPEVECICVTSPADKHAVRMIPDETVDADQVRHHMKNNHFFDESEEICFSAAIQTKKPAAFIKVSAVLQDVYGDCIGEMLCTRTENAWQFTHAPMPVGVYRVFFTALYGDKPLCEKEIVFEVFDPSGEKCAPTESGLPFLYSMPNEQRYLDRDAFDPWNPFPDCSMEHFYAGCSFTGDVAVKKRIWEITRRFGRKWYVWNSDHRTLTHEEFKDLHEEIIRHSDYCYYPLDYEWAVMRHDFISLGSYNGTGMMRYLHDFLSAHPEYDFGIAPDADELTEEQHEALMTTCFREWVAYANERIFADAERDSRWMRSLNPDIKRACYGPFPIYAHPMTTHSSLRHIGFPADARLAEFMFDGFAQLEDYPYSCSYHTYKGAFHLSHVLLHAPGVHIYPEQYTASEGGCPDGAVKDANPPLGKYDMPTYFNVTHAYEFVYNTGHLTREGFRFWENRGFMQRDFTPNFADVFIRNWKHVLHHEPESLLRSTAYLSEIPASEDRVKKDGCALTTLNRSDAGLAYVYETSRTAGLPGGFAFCWDTLDMLTPEMTDCIVLPSLEDAPVGAVETLRKLYVSGVSLIAVSRVDGLEDIFGVQYAPAEHDICLLAAPDGQTENIFPDKAQFFYENTDGEILLEAVGTDGGHYPVLMRKGKALLINAPVPELGHRIYPKMSISYTPSISVLLRETMAAQMHILSRPTAVSDNCGITLLHDRNGDTLLLAIDYSPYTVGGGAGKEKQSTILLHDLPAENAESIYGPAPSCLRDENGQLKGLWLKLHQQECALIRLS